MDIVFVGSVVDQETLKKLPDASVAGNKMQMGFIKGLEKAGANIRALSVEPHGMWRGNGKPLFVKGKKYPDASVKIQSVSYCNVIGMKQLNIAINLFFGLCAMVNRKQTVVIVYNTMSMFVLPVWCIAKLKKIKCVAIIADLPIQAEKSIIRKLEDRFQERAICRFDAIIPLTEQTAHDFAPGLPYCVVEAGCDPLDYSHGEKEMCKEEKKKIVFSGTLNALSGVELLMETMQYLTESDVVLHIYGAGPLQYAVENVANKTNGVVFHGRVSNEKMIAIQKQADLLVCPRGADGFTTKYTFPSKILEYLCTGNPVLSNRLPGIPEEYEQYINYADGENAKDWAIKIEEILKLNPEKYLKKAEKAKAIVLREKNWEKHGKTVLSFLEQ